MLSTVLAKKFLLVKLGIGDWGLGTGDWGLGTGEQRGQGRNIITNYLCPMPYAQSPLPNAPFWQPIRNGVI
ncbi:hypothetical protein FDUTEX481_08204 [Tolypothrix sp. PCC 7601]|nr:hypothetical protein FDUTEX481_08204 [Tolypothrix sp. PCC 7601]